MLKSSETSALRFPGQLVLDMQDRLRFRSVVSRTARSLVAVTTIAGLCALLLAWSLVASQRQETQKIQALAVQATQSAKNDQERVEMIDAFVYAAYTKADADQTIDRSLWVLPPNGMLGKLLARSELATRFLRPFFEPQYETFFKPGALQAYHWGTDCAGAARLMIRMLKALGIKASKLGLYSENSGGHAVVQASVDGRWVIADANHGYVYPLPDGRLATVADLARNPDLARRHLKPFENPLIADFSNTRTMNWEKIPLVMPFAYQALHRLIGDRVDRIPRPAFAELPKLMMAVIFFTLGALLLLPPAYLTTRYFRHIHLRERLAGLPAWLRNRHGRADERA